MLQLASLFSISCFLTLVTASNKTNVDVNISPKRVLETNPNNYYFTIYISPWPPMTNCEIGTTISLEESASLEDTLDNSAPFSGYSFQLLR